MKRSIGAAFVAMGILLFETAPSAGSDDLPRIAQSPEKTENSVISVECQRTSAKKARCTFHQSLLMKRTEKELVADFKEGKTWDELFKNLKPFCAKAAKQKGADKELQAIRKMCAAKSVKAFKAAVVTGAKRESKTCKLDQTSFSWEFDQLDADTWGHVSSGACNVKVSATLSRSPGTTLWTYSQTRSGPPNATDETCKHLSKPLSLEYSWKHHRKKRLQCEYVDF